MLWITPELSLEPIDTNWNRPQANFTQCLYYRNIIALLSFWTKFRETLVPPQFVSWEVLAWGLIPFSESSVIRKNNVKSNLVATRFGHWSNRHVFIKAYRFTCWWKNSPWLKAHCKLSPHLLRAPECLLVPVKTLTLPWVLRSHGLFPTGTSPNAITTEVRTLV